MRAHYTGCGLYLALTSNDRKLLETRMGTTTHCAPNNQLIRLWVQDPVPTGFLLEPGISVVAFPSGYDARTNVDILLTPQRLEELVTEGFLTTRWIGDRLEMSYWEPGMAP